MKSFVYVSLLINGRGCTVGLFLFLKREKKTVSLQLTFSDRPTHSEDFHDKFNDIIKNIFITNGLSYMSGWK